MKKTMQFRNLVAAAVTLGLTCAVPAFAQESAPAPVAPAPADTTQAGPATAAASAGASGAAVTPAPEVSAPAPGATAVPAGASVPPVAIPVGVTPPSDYVIGPEDLLSIVFWRDKEMSSDVGVRPDGKISLPLLNDIQAAGLTPDQLRLVLTESANKFVTDPAVTVVVKAINSRRVFITGVGVARGGPYPLGGPTTVLQMLATAGGVGEYAKSDKILIMRTENGKTETFKFNYKDVTEGKNLQQNILLKPGDTIIVP